MYHWKDPQWVGFLTETYVCGISECLQMRVKSSNLRPFDSHAARYAASLCVCLYPQPRALSILLRQ